MNKIERDENRNKLESVINSLLTKLESMEPGTEEYAAVNKELERLYKLRTEETKVVESINNEREKIDNESILEEYKMNNETDNLREKLEAEAKQRKLDRIFDKVEAGVKVTCLVGLSILGFIFEEHGCLRSPTFKNLQNTFKPKL